MRTVFNLLGPLTNPAGATRQLTGVAAAEMAEKVAQVLAMLGSQRAMVVHGGDGVDEISISAPTSGFLVEKGDVQPLEITPESLGLGRAPREAVRGGTVDENLRFARSVLDGEVSPARDVVLLNAGAGLFIAGLTDDLKDGVRLAGELLDSGMVRRQLEMVRQFSADLKKQREPASPS